MSTLLVANILGYIAAALGIVMFIPQAYQVHKTKNTKSISLLTFVLFDIGCVLWSTYGILIGAIPVLVVNVVLTGLNSYIVYMKLKHG